MTGTEIINALIKLGGRGTAREIGEVFFQEYEKASGYKYSATSIKKNGSVSRMLVTLMRQGLVEREHVPYQCKKAVFKLVESTRKNNSDN